MGLLGRYLDSLPPDARDRIIRAQEWDFKPPCDRDNLWGLVAHASGIAYPGPGSASYARQLELDFARLIWFGPRSASRIGLCFCRVCRRFGVGRTVRALKLRAARENRLPFLERDRV